MTVNATTCRGSPTGRAFDHRNRSRSVIFAWLLLRQGYSKPARIAGFSWLVVFVMIGLLCPPAPPANVQDSARLEKEDVAVTAYMCRLGRELPGVQGARVLPESASREDVLMRAGLFGAWASLYREGEDLPLDREQQARRRQFRALVGSRQSEEFPLLRQRMAALLSAELRPDGASAESISKRSQTLLITGPGFASAAGTRTVTSAMGDIVRVLRFRHLRLESLSSAESRLNTFDTPADDQLAVLRDGRWTAVD